MKKNNRTVGKDLAEILIIGLISGFSGFILGLLFAPKSGLKTRKILTAKLKDVIDRGKFALVEAKVLSEELLDKGKETVVKVSSKIRSKDQKEIQC